ncbi:MAG: hypothetical protein KF889_26665 [Alphaproteobacteria bacterium]|nr:hypothetical protein [Alphaproteobacteria bacterium]MCW5739422.1 hypothetical protein [Alphaproteobacteria bacterium]
MDLRPTARLIGACILPIALLEAGMQYFGGVGLLGPRHTMALNESIGLQYPSRCNRGNFGPLYAGKGDHEATMCTDAWGTIEPTSLAALLDKPAAADAPYLLACGGSATEITAVEPEERWVTRLSHRLGIPAINAAAASKSMVKCTQSLDYLLERIPPGRRPLILIATSVNTLGTFLPARFSGWTGGAIPDQPYAPPALHPAIRAWIPGLYHLAAVTVSAIGTRPTHSYADALAEGCCHMAGAANTAPPRRFDWHSEENKELFASFTASSLDAVDALIARHRIPRGRVVFVVEPNSFIYPTMPHTRRDFRQLLHGLDGKRLDLATSAAITQSYDEIYARVVGERYAVIRADRFALAATSFYDAVHMTADGAQAMAEHLAPLLREKLAEP